MNLHLLIINNLCILLNHKQVYKLNIYMCCKRAKINNSI